MKPPRKGKPKLLSSGCAWLLKRVSRAQIKFMKIPGLCDECIWLNFKRLCTYRNLRRFLRVGVLWPGCAMMFDLARTPCAYGHCRIPGPRSAPRTVYDLGYFLDNTIVCFQGCHSLCPFLSGWSLLSPGIKPVWAGPCILPLIAPLSSGCDIHQDQGEIPIRPKRCCNT